MTANKPRRKLLLRIGLALIAFIIALAAGEMGLRLLGVTFPLPYLPDEYTGSRLQPGWSGWFTKEGKAFVGINQAGFRDRDHILDKAANTFRVIVLGDSYVEAVQVPMNHAFWSVLENRMQQLPEFKNQNVEVISMGVSGWGTAQQLLALQRYGFAYEPDLVLLAFFHGNDIRNNSRQLEPEQVRPYFQLRNGDLVLDDSFLTDPLFLRAKSWWTEIKVALINRSRLLQAAQETRGRIKYGWQRTPATTEAGLDDQCYLAPTNKAWDSAWEVTEHLIQTMDEECQGRNIKFCLAMVTDGKQVHPDATVRNDYCQSIGAVDLSYPETRIVSLGQRCGFPVVVLAGRFRDHAEKTGAYLHGFANTQMGTGHWNSEGHRLAGEILAVELQSLIQ